MKKLLCSGVCVGLLAMASSAAAYMFNDMIDWWNASGTEYGENQTMHTFWDSVLLTENNSLYYMHDISDEVDFANGDLVTSAILELDFTNDFYDGAIYIPTSWIRGYLVDQTEYISYYYSGGGWAELGEVDNGQYDIGLDVSFINDSEGSLFVELRVSNHDDGNTGAWLDHSRLYGEAVTGGEAAAPVPEPATMILFGTGLVGLAGVCLRKMK
jgi:hypothetical protein